MCEVLGGVAIFISPSIVYLVSSSGKDAIFIYINNRFRFFLIKGKWVNLFRIKFPQFFPFLYWEYALLLELLLLSGYQKHQVLVKYCNMRSYWSFCYCFGYQKHQVFIKYFGICALTEAYATFCIKTSKKLTK